MLRFQGAAQLRGYLSRLGDIRFGGNTPLGPLFGYAAGSVSAFCLRYENIEQRESGSRRR